MMYRHMFAVVCGLAAAACGSGSDDAAGGTTAPATTGETGATSGETSATSETGGEPTTGGPGGSSGETSADATGATSETGETGAGTTGGADCVGCRAAFMGEDGAVCEASQALLDALFECVCGTCAEVCEATCTMNAPPSAMCQTCQSDAFSGACEAQLSACVADG